MANSGGFSQFCKLGHTVCRETDAVSCREMQGKVEISIGFSLSTWIYAKNARCSLLRPRCNYENHNQYYKFSMPGKNSGRLATVGNEICLN